MNRLEPTAKKRPKKNETESDLTEEFVDEIESHWEDIYAELTEEWQNTVCGGGTGGIGDEEEYEENDGGGGGCDGGGSSDDEGEGGGDEGARAGARTGPPKRKRGTKIRAGRKIQTVFKVHADAQEHQEWTRLDSKSDAYEHQRSIRP